MSSRRQNPHPQRAVNARTVLKAEKEEPLVLCSRIPDEAEDLEANHHQIQKEEDDVGEEEEGDEEEEEEHRHEDDDDDDEEDVFVIPIIC